MSWEVVSNWIEHHPGLASWVQALGAIVSIWGAFAISRSQQKSQLMVASKAALDKAEALKAVIGSAAMFITVFGMFVQKRPAPYLFRENWTLVNRQWLESSIFTLSQLPAHELGNGEMVRAYFGIMGAINDIGRRIEAALITDAFKEQEFFYMYEEILKQVRFVESYWDSFQKASAPAGAVG